MASRRLNNLQPGIFPMDLVFCRTCPMPDHGYFLRQPRSWAPLLGNPVYEPSEMPARRHPRYYLNNSSTTSESQSSSGWEDSSTFTEPQTDSGFRSGSGIHTTPPRRNAVNEDAIVNAFGAMQLQPEAQPQRRRSSSSTSSTSLGSGRWSVPATPSSSGSSSSLGSPPTVIPASPSF